MTTISDSTASAHLILHIQHLIINYTHVPSTIQGPERRAINKVSCPLHILVNKQIPDSDKYNEEKYSRIGGGGAGHTQGSKQMTSERRLQ